MMLLSCKSTVPVDLSQSVTKRVLHHRKHKQDVLFGKHSTKPRKRKAMQTAEILSSGVSLLYSATASQIYKSSPGELGSYAS